MDLTVVEGSVAREGFLLVDLDRFQGPLDLLLHLIRTQDIDVFDIPISTITDQYAAAYREDMAALGVSGDFAPDIEPAGPATAAESATSGLRSYPWRTNASS